MIDTIGNAVTRTSEVLAVVPEGDRGAWMFARCWLHAVRFEENGLDKTALRAALDDFDAIPAGLPGRAKLAAILINAQIRAGALAVGEPIRRAAALADIADEDDDPLSAWPSNRAVVRALTLVQLCQEGDPTVSVRSALAELSDLEKVVAGEQPQAQMLDLARLGLTNIRAQQNLDHAELAESAKRAEEIGRRYSAGSPGNVRAALMSVALAAQASAARGDITALVAAIEQIRTMLAGLGPNDSLRRETERLLDSVTPIVDIFQRGFDTPAAAGPELDAGLAGLRRLADEPGLIAGDRAARLATLGATEMSYEPTAPALADDGVRHLAEAVATAPAHDTRMPYYCMTHGYALLQRYESRRSREDLTDGIRVLERARTLAKSPAHPYWATASIMLGHGHRLAGRAKHGRQIAIEGLRGHAWNVLLQAHTNAAAAAARDASSDAIDVARWCLQDNAVDDAVAALDAGRGLIVYAATQIRGVADQLDRDHPGLAARWRQATARRPPSDVDADLRHEVLSTLAGLAGEPAAANRLLDPPSPHEIRAALTALHADALVYLIPGDKGIGAAVAVPARGESVWRPLPRLTTGAMITTFDTRPRRSRDATAEDERDETGMPTLDDVCAWAWDAAVGPVLKMLDLPRDGTGRVILVPMRELAGVPWHAARHGRQHAIQRAGFSYAASARLMCESAWSTDIAVSRTGLIVGDPNTGGTARDLPAARAEALAIHDAFYRPARYVGRYESGDVSTAGPGRRHDVLDWLAAGDGTMLHLACHAVVNPDGEGEDTAYLLLAGGERLSAEAMVGAVRAREGRDIALATLAACQTGVSSRGNDEAFSLATAFLAGGVRAVVSSRWAIPDEATSVLMFAFHHFLHAEPGGVPHALRSAQLWMLDPNRQELQDMPQSLRQRLRDLPEPEVADWAAFVHAGR